MTHPYDKYRQDKVGRRRAESISGTKPQGPAPRPAEANKPQRLGDSNNLWGPGYENEVANDWRRAAGESAEGKPNFKKG